MSSIRRCVLVWVSTTGDGPENGKGGAWLVQLAIELNCGKKYTEVSPQTALRRVRHYGLGGFEWNGCFVDQAKSRGRVRWYCTCHALNSTLTLLFRMGSKHCCCSTTGVQEI